MLSKRAHKRTTDTAVIRSWTHQDAPYRLYEITSLFGLPRYYLVAKRLVGGGEVPASRHRLKSAAVRMIEQLAKRI